MASSLLHRIADRAQRSAARSTFLVRLAVLIRNQARCVIKYHLAESPDVNETGEVWLRALVAPLGTRFVDVGANVGDWIGGIAAIKGDQPFDAIAIEPSASALVRLKERFAGDARVRIIDAAAGDSEGSMQLIEEPGAGRGSTLVPGLGRLEGTVRKVELQTLDDVLAKAGWDSADVVKIDAEGYDARVLRGAALALGASRIGVVQFEYNRAWQIAGDTLYGACTFLQERGYRVYLLKRDGLYTLDYPRYEEYYEYSNFVAIAPAWQERFAGRLRGTI